MELKLKKIFAPNCKTPFLLTSFFVIAFILSGFIGFSQTNTTLIPDANFEKALISLGYDSGTINGEVLTANISGITSLYVSGRSIASLTGIEAFTALTTLSCSINRLTSLDVSANTALTSLRCYDNQLTSLDVSANTALTTLGCYSNRLTSLDVSANTALTALGCYSNRLTSLDVSANTALTTLSCSSNRLTSLDVSANTALTDLSCSSNRLTSLDVSANTALTYLSCSSNRLTSLDVSANTALTYLQCDNNQLTSLDVSSNTALTILLCSSNRLTSLDVSANTALTALLCSSNRLTSLDVSANTALTALVCYSNRLTSLDVSANTALTTLACFNNQLRSLDVSANTALTTLSCSSNRLTSLDVSANTALTALGCSSNRLTSLDVSANTALTALVCSSNRLTSLDVSANTALTALGCYSNRLTSLNIKNENNTFLRSFYAYSNPNLICIQVDNVEYSTANWSNIGFATGFSTDCNSLSIITSPATLITTMSVQLGGRIVSDGEDAVTERGIIYSLLNTNITIKNTVDVIKESSSGGERGYFSEIITGLKENTQYYYRAYAINSNGTRYGAVKSFNTISASTTTISDPIFEQALINLGYDSGEIDGAILTTNISGITYLDISNKNIESLAGIEAFTALTSLRCYDNQLTSLDVSENTALTSLRCYSNRLTSLDISSNTALTYLSCSSNKLTSLDVSSNTALTDLQCDNNQLTSLDVSSNTDLTYLDCSSNRLTSLDVSANTALTALLCSSNRLTSLDVSANTALTALLCSSNRLTSLDVSANTALTALLCSSNRLTSLDVSANTALTALLCSSNRLTSLDVSANTALTALGCSSNRLTSLNIKNENNTFLRSFYAYSNPNLICIQVDNVEYSTANWSNIGFATGFSTDCNSLSIITSPATLITTMSVQLGGRIVSDGEDAVTERGIIYSLLNTNITIKNTVDVIKESSSGGERGYFSEIITGLKENTQYYYRAYAINSNGTRYGAVKSFNTISASTTTISDPIFEQALINLGYDSGEIDGAILTTNISGITYLDISNKNIESLAGIEAFTALTSLRCYDNQLTSLDVSENTALTSLRCYSNRLTSLDISSNTALTYLSCSSNKLTSLDVSSNTALTNLICSSNKLTSLDISGNTALTYLRCSSNKLTTLDISGNTALTYLNCSSNQLISLNVKNENNTNFSDFFATGNPDLTCIQVDNASYSTANWTSNIDSQHYFSENCATAGNKNFELAGISISPNPTSDNLNIIIITEKADYILLNIRGQVLKKGTLSTGKSKINISSLSRGIYFLNIRTDKGSFTEKVARN